jgi:hypothetical protein
VGEVQQVSFSVILLPCCNKFHALSLRILCSWLAKSPILGEVAGKENTASLAALPFFGMAPRMALPKVRLRAFSREPQIEKSESLKDTPL